jgi:hypothetical protein
MKKERSLESHAEDHFNQYVAVLLELYLIRQERRHGGPMDRSLIQSWRRIVSTFETHLAPVLQRKLRYRVSRAEGLDLGPLDAALARYAWFSFLTRAETAAGVVGRWRRHLTDPVGEDHPVVVSNEVFDVRRRLRDAVRRLRESGLWPWAGP